MAFFAAPIIAFVGLSGVAATFATAVLGAALSFGASYLINKLLGPKKPKVQQAGGVQLQIRIDADVPQSLLLGRVATSGSLFYGESFGEKNKFHVEGISLADHPCTGLVKVFVDGQEETYTAAETLNLGNKVDTYAKDSKEYLHFKFYDGTQTTADQYAVDNLGTKTDRPWTSAMVGRGITYVRTRNRYEPELVPSPMRWRFVVDGIKLYDPRKDDTAGGTGLHRFDDLSTHEFTQNLIVMVYNILRGIRVADSAGVPQHFYGLEGVDETNLPYDIWAAAMNEADELVDGVPKFHGGGEVSVDEEPLEVISAIMKACDGTFAEVGGVYKVYVGAPGLTTKSITDETIRADEQDVFQPVLPLQLRVNHVTGVYTSPTDGWVPKVPPPRRDADAETADGRRISGELDAPFIQDSAHMQRMMKEMLINSRKERRHRIPLPPSCWGLEPGDVLEWTSDRNGYTNKRFVIDTVEDFHDLSIMVSMTEDDPTAYDWDPLTDYETEPTGTLTEPRPAPLSVSGFAVTATTHTADSGAQRAALQVTWTDPDDADVTGITVQWRKTLASTAIENVHSDDPTSGELLIVNGIQSLTEYQVRARFVSMEGYRMTWTAWLTVTTVDGRIGTLDVLDNAITAAKINNLAVTAAKLASAAVTLTKFASGLRPIEVVSTLPTTGNTDGRTVFLTTDKKLYRYDAVAAAFISTVPATDLTGQVVESQLADAAVAAAKLQDGAVLSGKLAAGSVVASKLAIGVAQNWIRNSDFQADLTGWTFSQNGTEHSISSPPAAGESWNIQGDSQTTEIRQTGTGSTLYADLTYGPDTFGGTGRLRLPVSPGKKYQFSVYAGLHRCDMRLYVKWQQADGTHIVYHSHEHIHSGSSTGGQALDDYEYVAHIFTAPAGAANATVFIRKLGTKSLSSSYLFLTRAFFGLAHDNQTEFTPWSASAVTLIENGHLTTDSVTADKIAANTITANEIAAGTITANEIAANTITAGQIAAGAINTDELAANAVTAAKIAAGTITADLIAAKAITVDKLAVTSFDNLWENAGFETGSLSPNAAVHGGGLWDVFTFSGVARSGTYYLRYQASGQTSNAYVYQTFEVSEGQSFYMEAWVRASATPANRAILQLRWFDEAGTDLGWVNGTALSPQLAWNKISVTATAPAGAATVHCRLFVLNDGNTTNVLYDDVYLRRKFGGELIVDGGIKADNIEANTITANEISIGGVVTTSLAADAATSVVNAFTSGNVNSGSQTNWTEIQRITVDPVGEKVIFLASCFLKNQGGTTRTTQEIRIRRGSDGAIVSNGSIYFWSEDSSGAYIDIDAIDDAAPSGNTTYYWEARMNNFETGTFFRRSLTAMVSKR